MDAYNEPILSYCFSIPRAMPISFLTRLVFLFIFMLIIGCNKTDTLTFEPLIIEEKACEDCTKVSLKLPNAIEKTTLAKTINTALEEEIISLLLFDEETETNNLNKAIASFVKGYEQMKERYSDETTPWEAKIEGTITYEDSKHLTIALNSYLFTGGAHGYSTDLFLNFDKEKAKELETWELFKNEEDFQEFAETKFREQEAIPADKSINYTGLMFERDRFYLPENIGFTEKGIQLLYNPYEVASFADGAITLLLPYEEVKPYLAHKGKS